MIDFFDKYLHIISISLEEIRDDPGKIYWDDIVNSQKLSEDFIKEFQNYLDWWTICFFQNLSKEFIIEFFDKLNLDYLINNEFISDEIKEFCRMFL